MCILISITLGAALIVALSSLWHQHQAAHRLHNALLRKQPLLREPKNGIGANNWEHLRLAANELIAEVNRLQQLRSGQLTQLEVTLGSLQEAVLIVDSLNHILLANSALHEIFPRATNILGQRLELILQSASFLQYVERVRKRSVGAFRAPRHNQAKETRGRTKGLRCQRLSRTSYTPERDQRLHRDARRRPSRHAAR
jgi:two-component system phosphate regulon sensor histidine kinase PhoR